MPAVLAALFSGSIGFCQEPASTAAPASTQQLPDKPEPATPQVDSSSQAQQPPSEPQPPGQQPNDREKARQQVKQQEGQRMLGILPMFNTSYDSNAVSLTSGEKIKLAFRTAIDPVNFAIPAVIAGLGEINAPPNNNGFGWGADGYMKKWGAAYLDSFDGAMIGNGLLPALLRQDPRYFRMGHGNGMRRALYSLSRAVICKHDNTGKWEPNYSNVGGNLAAGALSNLYYPSGSDRGGWQQTITSAMVVTATGAAGSMLQEFWPDISRKLFHKDPTHGLDDKARAAQHAEGARQSDKPKQAPAPAQE